MNEEAASPSSDSLLDALGHGDRRWLLRALLKADSEGDLPIEIDQLDHESTDTALRLSMHHVHLPKLDDRGFVDANLDQYSVTTGPRFDEMKPLLELLDTNRHLLPDDWV